MASAFWYLEDGRGFARRWTGMAYMLELITDELENLEEASTLHNFLEPLVFREARGYLSNGFGGFVREGKSIMFNFDLRSFTPQDRSLFWVAAENAYERLEYADHSDDRAIKMLFETLLDMNRRVRKGEDPKLLSDT